MSIHIYAEYLNHIRALSVQINTANEKATGTRARLLDDGTVIEVISGAECQRLRLPVQVAQPSNNAITLPDTPTKTLRFRTANNQDAVDPGNIIPWTSSSLSSTTELSCAACKAVLLSRGTIRQWKDLPSEGWAEMMEFWHCHKPNEPHTHDDQTSRKGYSAASQLIIEPGVGLLNATSMLLAVSDLRGIEVQASRNVQVQCSSCQADLGNIESNDQAYRLSKFSLSVSVAANVLPITLDQRAWSACNLLAAMDSQGVRRFSVICPAPGKPAYSVWIFAPHLLVAASNTIESGPLCVAKVMYKPVDPEQALRNDQALNGRSSSTGMLELPYNDFLQLERSVMAAGDLLPVGARSFEDWKVALLPRFTKGDV